MDDLKFSHDYDKLDSLKKGETITTIRKNNYFQTRDKVKVMQNGSFLCYAQLLTIDKIIIRTISTETLIKDTAPHAKTRKEALELLNSFYPKKPLHEGSFVFLYHLRRILAKDVIVKITLQQSNISEEDIPESLAEYYVRKDLEGGLLEDG